MQTKLLVAAAVVMGAVSLSSCSKMGALSADNFNVTPNPMETQGDQVSVTINGRFPEKYMKKKAVVRVTPVLRYATGETAAAAATFQGEKVEGNDQTISYRVGGNYTMKANYAYKEAMQKSDLYLQFDATVGKKTVKVPEVKVAEGILATSALVDRTLRSANAAYAPDAYQHVIRQKEEANIKFLIQQAKIRTSELKSVSVQNFIKTLKDIQADQERKALDNVEVVAYASPDGGMSLNDRLAQQREKTTADYVNQTLKKTGLEADVETRYTAEDWDGFQELVAQSNIQDKEVILRVLSMYQDPEEREKQIRNISAAFTELASEVLPQLRRSRMMVNYDLIGRSDDEIQAQYKSDASQLSVEELLYSATLTENVQEQKDIMKKTAQIYPNDYRALNNLATMAYQEGDFQSAKNYVEQALRVNGAAAEPNVNAGLLSLLAGDNGAAQTFLAKGANSEAVGEALGNLYIKQGNYAQAVKSFGDAKTNSAGLAQLLTKDYMTAAATLSGVAKPDAMTYYLKAIIAARTNNTSLALDNLGQAIQQDPSLAQYAAKDLEFRSVANNAKFQLLTK